MMYLSEVPAYCMNPGVWGTSGEDDKKKKQNEKPETCREEQMVGPLFATLSSLYPIHVTLINDVIARFG